MNCFWVSCFLKKVSGHLYLPPETLTTQDIYYREHLPPGYIPPGHLPPRTVTGHLPPRGFTSWICTTRIFITEDIYQLGHLLPRYILPGFIPKLRENVLLVASCSLQKSARWLWQKNASCLDRSMSLILWSMLQRFVSSVIRKRKESKWFCTQFCFQANLSFSTLAQKGPKNSHFG